MVKPRQVEPQGPPLSAKGPFVKFDPVDSTIRGNNHKKPLDIINFPPHIQIHHVNDNIFEAQ